MDSTTDTSFPLRSLNTFDNTAYQAERRLARKKHLDEMERALQRAGSIHEEDFYNSDMQSLTSTQTAPAAFGGRRASSNVKRARDMVTDLYGNNENSSSLHMSSHQRRAFSNLAPRKSLDEDSLQQQRENFLIMEDVELAPNLSSHHARNGMYGNQKGCCYYYSCMGCFAGCWSNKTRTQKLIIACAILVILPLFISVLVVGINNIGGDGDGGSDDNDAARLDIIPPIAVDPIDLERHLAIRSNLLDLAISDPKALDETGTPSNLALRWLTDYDEAFLDEDHLALSQRYALAVFFFATHDVVVNVASGTSIVLDNSAWTIMEHWMSSKGICMWYGVSCPPIIVGGRQEVTYNDNSAVLELNLTNNNMRGEIPMELTALENLQLLDLGANRLFGSIPTGIGHLRGLLNLYLMENQLTGFLPSEMGMLSNLKNFHCGKNLLEGNVPTQISMLKELESLGMDQNYFSGTLPDVSRFDKLSILYLDNNAFSGEMPFEWYQMASLQDLRLSKNYLTGTLPSTLFKLPRLELLYLGNNDFSGAVPDLFFEMPRLKEVHLYKNQFSGLVPETFGHLSLLRILYLDNNEFSGQLPDTLGDLDDVTELYLYNNALSGELPSTLDKMKNLRDLRLGSNNIGGEIPSEIGRMLNLEVLYLQDNDFFGTLPSDIGNLDRLKSFRFYRNKLEGTVPDQVCDLKTNHGLKFLAGDCDETEGQIECECCNECYP